MAKKTTEPPWSFRVTKRDDRGESITFEFQGKDFMESCWYPPWRNDLERANAVQIVEDLNAAFTARNNK
jgi:hypothetical protein